MASLSEPGHGWEAVLHEDMRYCSTVKNPLHWCRATCSPAGEDLYQAAPVLHLCIRGNFGCVHIGSINPLIFISPPSVALCMLVNQKSVWLE